MIRVLIAEQRAEHRDLLHAVLAAAPEMETAGTARDGREAVRLAWTTQPDIVLLASDLPPHGGFAAAETLTASGLPLGCILLTDESALSPHDLRRAMRAGASDLVCRAAISTELCEAVRSVHADGLRRRSPEFLSERSGNTGGQVVAVSGAKGGIGKTTLAVNLAVALAVETGEPTVLVDLHTQFGDAALLLNVSPRRTLADWVRSDEADRDRLLLDDHLERHESGLRLLAGVSAPMPLDLLTPDDLDQLLALLRQDYRHVVLDVPSALHETTRRALTWADTVLLTANLFDLTTLADTRVWLEALSGTQIASEAVQVVLNRVSATNRLQIPDIVRTLDRPVPHLVPNDGRLVPGSVNAGVPFVLSHPASRVACSVLALARSLACLPGPAQTRKEPRWRFPMKK